MIEISLNNAVKNFGFKNILDEFNLEVTTGERVALIGPNGCGKTTIFKIISGEEQLDKGMFSIRNGVSLGYLSQIPPQVEDNCTVRDVLMRKFKDILEMERNMRELENKFSSANEAQLEKLLNTYGKLQDKFEKLGGYTIDEKMSKICNGFKIKDEMLDRSYNTLSGGEKTIVNLASLIISNPDILLLDEPTNHLDIDTLEWFESFLSNYKGTVLISSHDRYFLDKVATKTVLIDHGKEDVYCGNYTYYLKESERRELAEFEQYKNQQKKIEAMKETIKKLKEWGERGDNPRFFRRAACIERKLEKMEVLERPEKKKSLPLDFEVSGRSGKDVLVVEDLGIVLGEKEIFDGAEMDLKYGEKVCLMGKNGTGKSTFIKAILNGENICQGEIKLGSNVFIGYIPQEIKFEDENATVLEIARHAFNGTETHLRASLAKFLFYGENVFKRVGTLSGGEKVRLKLFELIQKKANLLILDEPTNHIDIDTKEILEEALKEYQGTLFFVSHDRYFINTLAERVLNIENKKMVSYLGNYDFYKEHKYQKLTRVMNHDSLKKIVRRSLKNMKEKFSEKIDKFLENSELEEISIGCSDSQVFKISKNDNIYFLKKAKKGLLTREHNALEWLQGKLPVPKIVIYETTEEEEFLITEGIQGEMVCSETYLKNPDLGLKIIASAFKKIYQINIEDCPFDVSLNYKLNLVEKNVNEGLVTDESLKPEILKEFGSAKKLLNYLKENKFQEELCFSHGDTSLPNMFANGDSFAGFIDVGECGIADKWFDLAICEKSIKRNYGEEYISKFYLELGIEPDRSKINYYLLLMELYL